MEKISNTLASLRQDYGNKELNLNELLVFNPILSFIFMMIFISTFYWTFIFRLKLSEEINNKAISILQYLKKKISK